MKPPAGTATCGVHMSLGTSRRIRVLAVVLVTLPMMAATALELTYRWVLADFPSLPTPMVDPPPPPDLILLPFWREQGGDDPVSMGPIYPWSIRRLFPLDAPSDPSARISRFIALAQLADIQSQLPPTSRLRNRAREIVLTVWISRHWTARQALYTLLLGYSSSNRSGT